jgi:hypothetical protein
MSDSRRLIDLGNVEVISIIVLILDMSIQSGIVSFPIIILTVDEKVMYIKKQ